MPEQVPVDVAVAAVKEAVTEWLDAKWAQFGKWTFKGVAAALLGALVTFLVSHIWWK